MSATMLCVATKKGHEIVKEALAGGPAGALVVCVISEELGIPQKAMVVLCVAAIKRHHKQSDHLLQEFHTFRQANPELPVWLVIDGGWEKETIESQTALV